MGAMDAIHATRVSQSDKSLQVSVEMFDRSIAYSFGILGISRQLVVVQFQLFKFGEAPQFRRNCACEFVAAEDQRIQVWVGSQALVESLRSTRSR